MFNDPSGHDVGFGNAFPSDPGNGFDSNTSRNVWLNYGGYQSSFIGQVITTPVKQFDQHFIDWSWWSLPRNAPLPRTSGINICGLVAPNGINNKTWLDVGDAAVKHGFSYSTGMQPSQAAATYKDTFGANKVTINSNITPKNIYDALKSNKAVVVDMMDRQINKSSEYSFSTTGTNSTSHFARVYGMDWDTQKVFIEDTLSKKNDRWILSVDELQLSMTNPEVNTNAKNAETVDFWGVTIDQSK